MDIIACKEKRENVHLLRPRFTDFQNSKKIKNKIFSFKVQNFPKIKNFHKISK
jgi:hypothetical protein